VSPSNNSAVAGERPTIVHHYVLAALLVITFINYLQRNCISPAETTIREELRLEITDTGNAISAFFLTYALLQVPSGWLTQRWGPRLALTVFATGWSLLIGLSALASGVWGLLAARLGMGALQAGIFPCATLILASWYPASRRGLVSALLNSFMLIGSAVGSIITGVLLGPLGWRWLFAIYAVPGLLWSVWFFWWFRNRPQEHPHVNAAELAVIADARPAPPPPREETPRRQGSSSEQVLAHRDALATRPAEQPILPAPPPIRPVDVQIKPGEPTREPIPWAAIVLNVSLLLVCSQQFCRAGSTRFFDTWLATYLQEAREVSKEAAGALASLPQWAGVVGGLVGGMISDEVLRRTGSRRAARKGVAIASICASMLCYALAYPIADVLLASIVLSLGAFLSTFASPCAYALTMDMGGRHVAIVFSLMNMTGNLGSLSFTWLTPQLKTWSGGNWDVGLGLFIGLQALAALCWLLLSPEGTIGETPSSTTDKVEG
jgi:ACS family glucarate transporter-like MFS transporter